MRRLFPSFSDKLALELMWFSSLFIALLHVVTRQLGLNMDFGESWEIVESFALLRMRKESGVQG